MTFLGLITTGSGGAGWKITLRLTSTYGNHLSIRTDCGLLGNWAIRSTTTLRGGAGKRLPEMVMICWPIHGGGCGGASRMTKGSGVHGLAGCWRITIGGAGAGKTFGSFKLMFFILIYAWKKFSYLIDWN